MPQPPAEPSFWKRLPPAYKKYLGGAVVLYLLCMGGTAALTIAKAPESLKMWHARVPFIGATIGVDETAEETAMPAPDDSSADAGTENNTEDTPQTADAGADVIAPPSADTDISEKIDNTTPADTPAEAPVVRKSRYVALIVTQAGLSLKNTETALKDMPAPVTFAFSPYTTALKDWLQKSTTAKHENLLLLPMEPVTYPKDDPGPKTLLTRMGAKENEKLTDEIIALAPLGTIVGVMNDQGGRFLADAKASLPVMGKLAQKKLRFVENLEGSAPLALGTADMSGVSYMAADVKIDAAPTAADIKQQFDALEKISAERGYAIGVIETYPVSLRLAKEWADSLDSRGIRLVPLTEIFKEMSKSSGYEEKE